MTKEFIEDIRQSLIPFVKKELLEINYEGLGKSNAEEFEKDLNEVLDLASKALEQPTSGDCVSRQSMLDAITEIDGNINMDIYTDEVRKIVKDLPPVTPTQCIAAVRFSKDDLREICNERIALEYTHGTCKDCKHCCYITGTKNRVCEKHGCMQVSSNCYCADFEKRGAKK